MQILIGFLAAVLIGGLAWRAKALSLSGAVAAAFTGGMTFGMGGLDWAVILLAFFITSSVLSRLSSHRKAALSEKFAKGSQRDWKQVLANGGLGAGLALIWALYEQPAWAGAAFTGAMAAVTADTWATEVGVLSPSSPRLVTSGRAVERGASGAVSLLGSLAALAGGLLIGGLAAALPLALDIRLSGSFFLLAAGVLGGIGGAFADSLLGATVQAIYYCPACAKETERHPLHSCGTATAHLRGWRWLDNDLVNLTASLVGALIALGAWRLLVQSSIG